MADVAMIPAFALFPPEINSALIFGGAGSGPLFAAGSAWDGLAAELAGAAASFNAVVLDLAGGAWLGPSSMSMVAAAAPYVTWLNATAAQAEMAAAQARAAAAAFEAALMATVPTPAVLANRIRLLALIATNFLGQNTPAIAQTELEYMEMWAQDVAAMLAYYAESLTVATGLPPVSPPPTGLAGLVELVTAPFASLFSQVLGMLSSTGAALFTQLQSVLAALTPVVSSMSTLLTSTPVVAAMSVAQIGMYPASALVSPMMVLAAQGAGPAAPGLAGMTDLAVGVPNFAGSAVGGLQPLGGVGTVSAGLGNARWVGAISVPPTWQGAMPAPIAGTAISVLGGAFPTAIPTGAATATGSTSSNMRMMPVAMGKKDDPGDKSAAALRRGGARPQVRQSRPRVVPRGRTK
jgi:PPE-repeat protein